MYAMEFRDPNVGSPQKFSQLCFGVDRVLNGTGAKEMGLITHSSGGHNSRYALPRLKEMYPEIDFHFLSIGQAINGLHLADLAAAVISHSHYEGAGLKSKVLADLRRRAQYELQDFKTATFIGANDTPTWVGLKRGGFQPGDGYTPASDIRELEHPTGDLSALKDWPGLRVRLVSTGNLTPLAHALLVRYPAVVQEIGDTLRWSGLAGNPK